MANILTRIFITAVLMQCASECLAQSVKDFYKYCSAPQIGEPVILHNARLKVDLDDIDTYQTSYAYLCDGLLTIYNRPIEKILIKVDTLNRLETIDIHLPFDSILHKEMESDLGKPEMGWMAKSEDDDASSPVINTRFWTLPKYRVGFRCTRYSYMFKINQRDYIVISLIANLPRKPHT